MKALGSFSFFLTLSIVCGMKPWEYKGSTPAIKEIILGRCAQFEEIKPQNHNQALYIDVDCAKVWSSFSNSFASKDTCKGNEITEKSYEAFFKLAASKKPLTDQALFWSGTRYIAHEYTAVQSNLYTLEDTFPGYLANELKWCGCKNCKDGIDYNNCDKDCAFKNQDPYWSSASRLFAENAKGTAYVMVNGTTSDGFTAYYNKSYFGRIELPTMGKMKQVNRLVVVVVNDLDVKPKEKCGEGTLINLVQDATKAGIKKVECIDQPRDTLFLLCAKYPNARQCVSMSNTKTIRNEAQKQRKVRKVRKVQKPVN
ncbi:ADP-ribosyl cyclase/cyclic ADP-ribose hydrolase isoform X1 [Hydra vulgaris]|uniref:ADP-ribosyl cyclase/cyclic ADP-ribose hydrolase isoform X1 n=1 Tax=Hydra vulgaris TaxID=6087 RepID=UPI000192567C|nr:ADP-ribosyl cyclase/cyclic ADP-ribose hydrolase [Hydra vulgaris]